MKAYYEPIATEIKEAKPTRIYWRHNTYYVQDIIECWVIQNRWWSREERRDYMLVETDGATMEIYHSNGGWTIARLAD